MTTTTTTDHERWRAEAREARLRALSRDLRLAARILNPMVADLLIAERGPAPAWTDGTVITLNRDALPAMTGDPRSVAVWAGATWHELGHTLLTPRQTSSLFDLMRRAESLRPGIWQAHNIAEDQRQERLMIERFAPMRGYLLAAVSDLILADGADLTLSWVLLCGRTYVPVSVRQQSRALFAAATSDATASEVARLIASYQRLADPGEQDSEQACAILLDLDALLSSLSAMPESGCGAAHRQTQGQPATPDSSAPTAEDSDSESQQSDADSDADQGDQGDQGDADADSGDQGDADADSGDQGDADADSGDQGDADADSGDQGDAESDSGDQGDAESGAGAEGQGDSESAAGEDQGDSRSAGAQRPDSSDASEAHSGTDLLDSALSEAVSEVLRSPDVERDLRTLLDAIEDATPERPATRIAIKQHGTASASAHGLRDLLADTLSGLRAASESEWLRAVDHGRINVGRLCSPLADPATLFDRYSPDSLDATSAEVMLLVDLSGSMGAFAGDLSEAVWALRHACQRSEVALTVLGFDHRPEALLIAEPGDAPSERVPVLRTGGGTSAAPALRVAFDTLRQSDAGHRLMVILSDGEWSDAEQGRSLIAGMVAEGIDTLSALFIEPRMVEYRERWNLPAPGPEDAHGAERFVVLTDLSDLARLVADLIEQRMSEGLSMRH